jgi:hypothetical protein
MVTRILESLKRQERALALLAELLTEEFSLLARREATSVSSLEFSIQELLRQMAAERTSLQRIYAVMAPSAKRLVDVLDLFAPEDQARAQGLLIAIERVEKRCSTLSTRNYQMALGLYDMTKSCLGHLQSHLVPKKSVYGSRGRLGSATPAPGRINGRF